MKGVTGMMAWLGHVPGKQRCGLYGHGDIDFRIPDLAEMEAASALREVPARPPVQ